MQNGPIFIVDDDLDDHEIVREIWNELKAPNEIVFFSRAEDVLERLYNMKEAPFMIICDINLPKMNGFDLRQKLLESGSRKLKSVPFIFWTTNASEVQIEYAYNLSAHGFFVKGTRFDEVRSTLNTILNYWSISKMPVKYD
ncbi:MAG: response regulator [Chitinophagaceae bacterium]|nr:response regulator [Chitinophagaceae bacterium]